MYQDALLQFSAAQSLTAGTQPSANTIDLTSARDIGKGEGLKVDCRVNTAFAGGTSLQVSIQVADDVGFTTNLVTVNQTGAIPVANLPAGASIPVHIDRVEPFGAHRYMRLYYTIVGTMTAGSVTAGIVKDSQDQSVAYASGFSVA